MQRIRDILEFSLVPIAYESNIYDVQDGSPHHVRIRVGDDDVEYGWNGEIPAGWECLGELVKLVTEFEPDEQQNAKCEPKSFMPPLAGCKIGKGASRLVGTEFGGISKCILEAVSYTDRELLSPAEAKCFGHRHRLSDVSCNYEERFTRMCVEVLGEGDCLIDDWSLAWRDALTVKTILEYARVPLVFQNGDDDQKEKCQMLTICYGNHNVVHRWHGTPPKGFEPLMQLIGLATRYGERICT